MHKKPPHNPPGKRRRNDLSASKQVFVQRVIATNNVTQSYLDAGHVCSRATASVNGHRLLRKTKIAAAVQEGRRKLLEVALIDGKQAMIVLSAVAGFRPSDVFDLEGKMLPLHEWPERAQLAVTGWKDGEVRLGNKLQALLAIAEADGKFERKNAGARGLTLEQLIAGSRRRG
jgi:hypothetical protein